MYISQKMNDCGLFFSLKNCLFMDLFVKYSCIFYIYIRQNNVINILYHEKVHYTNLKCNLFRKNRKLLLQSLNDTKSQEFLTTKTF